MISNREKDAMCASLIVAIMTMVFVPVVIVYLILAFGFVLSYLWGWFVVPLGVPSIGMMHAYGISLVMSMVSFKPSIHKDDKEVDKSKVVGLMFAPWFALGLGYIISLLM